MDQKDDLRKEGLWEQALERAQLGVWDWNLLTNDCFYSATWARMLGYELNELPNASDLWLQLAHPDDRVQAVESGERHIAGLTPIIETEMRFRHKAGHWVWVLDRGGVVERAADGTPLRMMGVQTDITRQKAAETELERVNIRFRLALAASGTGIWHHDIDSKRSFWDKRTRRIFGVISDGDEVPTDLWHTFLHPDDRDYVEKAHEIPVGSDHVTSVRYRIIQRNGEVRHVESLVRFVGHPDSTGQILGTVRDITEEVQRQENLAYAARHDALTGLLNRAACEELLGASIAAVRDLPLAIFYIDLDYFKALNDFAGHSAGDAALKMIAAGIRASIPSGAQAARLGGDEFAVVLPACAPGQAEAVAQAILNTIRDADLGPSSGSRKLAASIGIALISDNRSTVADALACADDACYAAKASGRNRFSVFSSQPTLSASGLNAARMASDTMDALDEGRLELFAQEIHQLGQPWETMRRAEVLARLVGRNGQWISPVEFISAAERFGMAPRLDRWIIKAALTRFGHAMTSQKLALNFNLSAQTLSDPGLWEFVDKVIEDTQVPHNTIVFEITETAAVTNFEAAERFVRNARERACLVSLDDFGAGLSSFEYLRRFPVDSIKINGSFVEHMTTNKFDREIVTAINGIAKSLGYSVVAEKIEKQDALELLQEMGVEFGQGYLLHKPEPLERVVARALGAMPSKSNVA